MTPDHGRRRLGLGLSAGLALGAVSAPAPAALPQPASGRIERLENFASHHVAARHVDVWLPDGYTAGQPHHVLYMQDGQMLFDASTTWNRQAWQADVAVARLLQAGRIPPTLIVGIWHNGPQRYAEYYPEKMLALAPPARRRDYIQRAQNGRPQADAYLRFLVEELKPEIDRRYATRRDADGGLVMGSSMGGLISLYALCEYPQVFGGAAGLSAHWVGKPTAWGLAQLRHATLPLAALNYLAQQLPASGRHRLYIDRGSDALDSLYAPTLALIDDLLHERGYTAAQAITRVFEGSGHNEQDWARRLEIPLAFLLGSR